MSRILVAFASHYGQTRKIAERLADHLREEGHQVDLADLRSATHPTVLADYDVVVVGSRVETGRHAKEMNAFVRGNHHRLRDLPTALFSVSMSAAKPESGDDPNGYLASSCKELDWQPSIRHAFAGGLPYRTYGWFTRWMMKSITKKSHGPTDTSQNHELTNWTDVRLFANQIAALCPRRVRVLPHG